MQYGKKKIKITSNDYYIGGSVNIEYLTNGGDTEGIGWHPGDTSQYDDGDLYIKGIRPEAGVGKRPVEGNNPTTLKELKEKITTNGEMQVYIPTLDVNGNTLLTDENIVANDDDIIATGMVAVFTKNNQRVELTLIVRGDFLQGDELVGDGKIDNRDLRKTKMVSRRNTPETVLSAINLQAYDYYITTVLPWNINNSAIKAAINNREVKPLE